MNVDFSELLGKTLANVVQSDESIKFVTNEGDIYCQNHIQDCCEHVYVEDVVGEWADIIGSPILLAEESSNRDDPPAAGSAESYLWTYYKLATIKGSVDIRWFGSSNGYYGESVSFYKQGTEL